MARLPAKPCRGRCPRTTHASDGFCDDCRAKRNRSIDDRRGSARQRGYTSDWERARERFLAEHPLCSGEDSRCEQRGLLTPATVVDHKIPHRGDRELFWDEANWRALCKPCHDAKTMRESVNH